MAALDFAFLADFAKVEANGTLTSVGASWNFLDTQELPVAQRMSVAGRVRAKADQGSIALSIGVEGPQDTFSFSTEGILEANESARTYGDNMVGYLFALDLQVPLLAEGLYSVKISLDGVEVRVLMFRVTVTA